MRPSLSLHDAWEMEKAWVDAMRTFIAVSQPKQFLISYKWQQPALLKINLMMGLDAPQEKWLDGSFC